MPWYINITNNIFYRHLRVETVNKTASNYYNEVPTKNPLKYIDLYFKLKTITNLISSLHTVTLLKNTGEEIFTIFSSMVPLL